MEKDLREAALEYHQYPTQARSRCARPRADQPARPRARLFSGVAFACDAIVADPANASLYTSRANLVGVVTNGTAMFGLGNIGPLASKPVMEGKAACSRNSPDRRLRYRAGRERPGQADRHHRRDGADAGRHQPRRHQGAGVLLHRAAAGADEHPRLP